MALARQRKRSERLTIRTPALQLTLPKHPRVFRIEYRIAWNHFVGEPFRWDRMEPFRWIEYRIAWNHFVGRGTISEGQGFRWARDFVGIEPFRWGFRWGLVLGSRR